jgi:2-phospho-L-lactate guanylyltransferase
VRDLIVLVPAKPFAAAKSRLAPVLSPTARQSLSREFLKRTIGLVRKALPDAGLAITTSEPAIPALAPGCTVLPDGAGDLNGALDAARRAVLTTGRHRLLVLPTDLPFLSADELRRMAAPASGIRLAPDRRCDGTNAILLEAEASARFRFCMGPRSYAAHIVEAARLGLPFEQLDAPGLAFDVDLPEDFAAWRAGGENPDGQNGAAA